MPSENTTVDTGDEIGAVLLGLESVRAESGPLRVRVEVKRAGGELVEVIDFRIKTGCSANS